MLNKILKFCSKATPVFIAIIVTTFVVTFLYTDIDYDNNGYRDCSVVKSDVLNRVKGFIELDSSFNDSGAIERLDSAKKFLTTECYDSLYSNNGRFMDLPDESLKPVIKFMDSATEYLGNSYRVMLMWSETFGERVYTYTGVVEVNSDLKICHFRKIPHLK